MSRFGALNVKIWRQRRPRPPTVAIGLEQTKKQREAQEHNPTQNNANALLEIMLYTLLVCVLA